MSYGSSIRGQLYRCLECRRVFDLPAPPWRCPRCESTYIFRNKDLQAGRRWMIRHGIKCLGPVN